MYVHVYMMRGDATTGEGSWRRAREYIYIYIFELYYIKNDNFLRCICGDMEMSPTYTDMYVKTMPGKMNEGGRPKVRK